MFGLFLDAGLAPCGIQLETFLNLFEPMLHQHRPNFRPRCPSKRYLLQNVMFTKPLQNTWDLMIVDPKPPRASYTAQGPQKQQEMIKQLNAQNKKMTKLARQFLYMNYIIPM